MAKKHRNLKKEYLSILPKLNQYAEKLKELITVLLYENSIDYHQIEYRVKSYRSFQEKSESKSKYRDPLKDIKDLVGLRIISYYIEDVKKISSIFEKEFIIDRDNSIDKSALIDPDKFGYVSVHYVFELPNSRTHLTERKRFSKLPAELQIRTVLQHAWAAISHKLEYKSSSETPRLLRRNLHRLSALLELGDLEFSRLKAMKEDLEKEYATKVSSGDLSLELNASSLRAFGNSSKKIQRWITRASEIGFDIPDDKIFIDHIPESLFKLFEITGIKTVTDIDALINEADEWGDELLRGIIEATQEINLTPWANICNIITIFLIKSKKNNIASEVFDSIEEDDDLKEFWMILRDIIL